jgi:hypothetical protein
MKSICINYSGQLDVKAEAGVFTDGPLIMRFFITTISSPGVLAAGA